MNTVYRNKKLLQSANGQSCVLCDAIGSTVAAHVNSVALGKGTGIKAPDYFTVHVCLGCHDMIDGRRPIIGQPYRTAFDMWTWAYFKTVARWFEQGIVSVR